MLSPRRDTIPEPRILRRLAARVFVVLAAPILSASAEEARPPQPAAAPAETRRFGNWELVCERAAVPAPPEPAPRKPQAASPACKVVQRQVARESGQSVFLVTVLPAGQPGRLAVIVSTPLGGYLAPGMLLSVDRGRPFKVLVETCNAAGCHAGFALAGRIAQELHRGRELKVRLWTGKGSPADVAVPLAGLDPALAALRDAR